MKKLLLAFAACAASMCGWAADIEYTNAEKLEAADGSGYYYKWTQDGTLTIPEGGKKVSILLVGGGGAGGFCRGGGGGGGGVVYKDSVTLEPGSYVITVGAGGIPDKWATHDGDSCYKYSGSSSAATDGGSSMISIAGDALCEALGGGGGGTFISGQDPAFAQYGSSGAGRAGACGGGSAGKDQTEAKGTQGGNGGKAWSGKDDSSGGGGGAGENGFPATANNASGNGGKGVACSITGESVVYGGGGGAGVYSGTAGIGGEGGGGNGGNQGGGNKNEGMTVGVDGLGGGGGGASGSGNKWVACGGAKGGSGVVIVREVDMSVPFVSLKSVVAAQTGATIRMCVSHAGETGAETVDVYAGFALKGEPTPSLTKKFEALGEGAEFTYDLSDLQPETEYVAYFKAVNSAGVQNSNVYEVPFLTLKVVKILGRIPGYPYWPDEDMNAKNSTTDFDDCRVIFDGDTTTFCSRGTHYDKLTTIYDAGTAHGISKLRFYPWEGDNGTKRCKDFKLAASPDGVEWTELYDQKGVNPAANQWTEVEIDVKGPFRYFRITGVNYASMREMEFLSSDVLLECDRPEVWADSGLGAADNEKGVAVSGALVNTQQAQASVFGFFATADYGDDLDAWKAHGERFDIGTVNRGEQFSKRVMPPADSGICFLRLFADDGTETVASQCTEKFVWRSKAWYPTAYTDATKDAKWYNGDTGDYRDENASHAIVFDLSTLPAGCKLRSIRLWPRNNGIVEFTRIRQGKVYASADATTFSTTTKMSAGDRDVYAVGSSEISALNWTVLSRFQDSVFAFGPTVHEVVLDNLPKNARYLKVDQVAYDQVCEFEFRVVKRSGMYLFIK